MSTPMDSRAAAARLTLERDRQELRRTLGTVPGEQQAGAFPRSATFRWLIGHFNARALASTALTVAMTRPGVLPLVGSWLLSRRRGRRK